MKKFQQWLPYGLLCLAVVTYYLPWVWHSDAGLSPGAYDLAEWTTLHPTARSSNPALIASFLLRASLGVLSVLFALCAVSVKRKAIRWSAYLFALLLAWTIFPPLEFFKGAGADPNYQQQFMLGILTLVLVVALVSRGGAVFSQRARYVGITLLCLLGITFSLLGLSQGLNLIESLGVVFTVGMGVILFAGALGGMALSNIYFVWRQNEG